MSERLASALSPLWALTNSVARLALAPSARKLPCPVISVGNILAGGVGKTEVVAAIAARLTARGKRVVVASRGYGSVWENGGGIATDWAAALERRFPDEAIVILKKAPGVAVAVGRDRHGVLMRHWDELSPDVVLLDDGYQHFKLARDLDIIVHDFSVRHPVWRDLPRELTHVPVRIAFSEVPQSWRERTLWVHARYRLKTAVDAADRRRELPREALAFCGLGNPERFRRALEESGVSIRAFRSFSDHHEYSAEDARELLSWAGREARPGTALLTTLKDYVKLIPFVKSQGGVEGFEPLWVEIELELDGNERLLWSAIDEAVERKLKGGGR